VDGVECEGAESVAEAFLPEAVEPPPQQALEPVAPPHGVPFRLIPCFRGPPRFFRREEGAATEQKRRDIGARAEIVRSYENRRARQRLVWRDAGVNSAHRHARLVEGAT